MMLKLRCNEYGFDCDFVLEGEKNIALLEKLIKHLTEAHEIDHTLETITQIIVNRCHSIETIQS